MIQSVKKNSIILAIFAIACTAVTAVVNEFTKDTIAQQHQDQLLKTLYSIIDKDRFDNDIYQDCVLLTDPALGSTDAHMAYIAKKGEQPIAIAVTTNAPDGYNGNIELVVAVNIDGTISGVRALKHQETPGLGDKIELRKSDWINSFSGKKVNGEQDPQFYVAKDGGQFDQFTGATITPRAVVKAVKKTVLYTQKNQQVIFNESAACRSEQ
jgi:electron transport complex protein RnfG